MAKIIASPSRYIQGKGELKNIRTHVEKLGTKWFILTSPSGKKRVEPAIGQSLSGSECTAVYEDFNGECCDSEIGRITEVYQRSGCDVVIGIGGGKIHDTAKAVAYGVGAW